MRTRRSSKQTSQQENSGHIWELDSELATIIEESVSRGVSLAEEDHNYGKEGGWCVEEEVAKALETVSIRASWKLGPRRKPHIDDSFVFNVNGASYGNPGPAGIGGILCKKDGTTLCIFSSSIRQGTSPDAEVAMILQACQLCEEDNCPANCFVIIESDSLMVVSWANGISGVGNTKLLDSIWRLKIFCLDLDRRLLFVLFLGVAMLLRIFWLNKVLRMAWFKSSGLVELGLLRVGGEDEASSVGPKVRMKLLVSALRLMRLSENVGLPKDGSQLKSAIIDLIIFDGLIRPSLIRRWKSVAYNERNRLQMGCVVQLWSFRVGSNLWFALVNLNLKQEENVDSSSTGITSI
ncbi:hypothetical protein QYF36_020748 [Acer negundo]|nr:hypothetical protein QYF36_020748 [Acer negundo]